MITALEKRNSISIKETAKILEKSESFIRVGLQQERLPFGVAVKMSSIWDYHISPKLLKEYIGEFEEGGGSKSENK